MYIGQVNPLKAPARCSRYVALLRLSPEIPGKYETRSGLQVLRRPHDGLDGSALPVVSPVPVQARAALDGDGNR